MIIAPWFVQMVIISARAVKRDHRLPFPSEFAASFVIYGTLSLLARPAPKPATAMAWGLVVATTLNLFGTDGKIRLQPKPSTGVWEPPWNVGSATPGSSGQSGFARNAGPGTGSGGGGGGSW